MKALPMAFALAMISTVGNAGTLTIDWIGRDRQLIQNLDDPSEPPTAPAYIGGWTFSVSDLRSPNFTYSAVGDLYTPSAPSVNPYSATLMQGMLGISAPIPYVYGAYDISVSAAGVDMSGYLFNDWDDLALLGRHTLIENQNQGLYIYSSKGYWLATYRPDHAGDGTAWQVGAAPVPLPAAGWLLLAGLAPLIVRARRHQGR